MKIGAIHIKKGKFAKPRASAAEERARLEADFKRMTHAANHEPEWEEDDEAQEARRKKRLKLAVISTACLLAVVLIGLGIFLWSYSRDDGLIFDNVYALDINLGGMSQEQATQVLEEKAQAVYGAPLTIQLQDRRLVLTPEATTAPLDAAARAYAACRLGRDGNLFDRARARSAASLSTYTLEAADYLTLDTGYIQDAVNQLSADLESTLTQPEVTVEGQRPDLSAYPLSGSGEDEEDEEEEPAPVTPENGQVLTIYTGTPGRHLDAEALYRQILEAYSRGDLSTISTTYDETLPEEVDLEDVFQQYCVAPVDAVLDETTYVASEESLGYGFAVEQVQKQLDEAEPGEEIQVEFQILIPEHTKASLEKDLFRDVLAYAHTDHTWNSNRTRNLELACEAIDGYILKPGATFSFNDVVGERTAEKGYKAATVYSGMESVQELGGGVCQVSSTLYYCTLYADLEVVSRAVHTFTVDYVPLGMDATVYWGSLDYQFKNNTDYPIKINASVHDGYVDIELVGTDTKDYYVEMDYVVLSKDPWETKEREVTDGSYADGETITSPYTGYTVDTYKYKYDKQTDELISKELEAHSEYTRRDKVVAVVPRATEPPATTPPATEPPATEPPETDPPATEPPTEPATEPPTEAENADSNE